MCKIIDIWDIIVTFAQNITHDIMCRMKYNINPTLQYLTEFIGSKIPATATARADVAQLPLLISGGYGYRDIRILGELLTLAIPNAIEDCSPMQLSKHQAKMTEVLRRPVVFVLEGIESYNLTRLTRAMVNFIVPGKIIFIPSMMMVLRDIKSAKKEIPETMSPTAQLLVLYHLQAATLNGMSTAKIAEMTGMSYPTINVALKWLVANNLVELTGGKEKQVQFVLEGKALWEKAHLMMSSPVERIVYTDEAIDGSLSSGETAMGHYTMLAEPAASVVAISKASAKENGSLLNKQYGDMKVEVWKYTPVVLANGQFVDRLSLYLAMKDSNDERIQIECDTLIEEIQW